MSSTVRCVFSPCSRQERLWCPSNCSLVTLLWEVLVEFRLRFRRNVIRVRLDSRLGLIDLVRVPEDRKINRGSHQRCDPGGNAEPEREIEDGRTER